MERCGRENWRGWRKGLKKELRGEMKKGMREEKSGKERRNGGIKGIKVDMEQGKEGWTDGGRWQNN